MEKIFQIFFFVIIMMIVFTLVQSDETKNLHITRLNNGDIFSSTSTSTIKEKCNEETCIGRSSGTATAISNRDFCTCRCHQHLASFREDLNICVDDIHECPLAPFIGGSTSQQIPFVFLPLKGQIIHPSKEISFEGILKPVCVISGAKYLTEAGWMDLRNSYDNDVPFRLFRDEGRTFLQWIGEPDLRTKMSGRMVLVNLMCKELMETQISLNNLGVFAPCVAFRVVGTPSKISNNVTEVAFSNEAHATSSSTSENNDNLSVSEYVAIGICSILLGLIYVASIFLYLHLKKKPSSSSKDVANKIHEREQNVANVEEGIIKNNPLLNLTHHHFSTAAAECAYSDTNSSDNEIIPDNNNIQIQNHHEPQITTVMVHVPQKSRTTRSPSPSESFHQETSSFERLPEENVSIVETLDDQINHRPGDNNNNNPRGLNNGTLRKKLYFNPAYFEPHMLMTPPPAALEFLSKIREVISVARQKMHSKRYVPTLLNIPEEETLMMNQIDQNFEFSSRRSGSMISLKRENSRRKSCTGCPGCEPQQFPSSLNNNNNNKPKLFDFPPILACDNCSITTASATSESKQRSIRKWLEDIPVLRLDEHHLGGPLALSPKRLRSPTRSLPPSSASSATSDRALSPRPASERPAPSRKVHKPTSAPPPVPCCIKKSEHFYDKVPLEDRASSDALPDMIQDAMELNNNNNNNKEPHRIPTLTKKQMNAVINELTVHKTLLEAANRELAKRISAGYETDSLERSNRQNNGFHTPTEYAEIPSLQSSPSLSTALPIAEEITIENSVPNGNSAKDYGHENENYEIVLLKNGSLFKENADGGYSLVSEVYVNNGYNYGSNPSSNSSTLDRKNLKVRYDGGADKPGKLLIEVEDCLDHYIPVNESDEYDPDTLDRPNKSGKLSLTKESFRLDGNNFDNTVQMSNFNRIFGSLRELYEEKRKLQNEEGKLLTLEERHWKRQRIKTTSQQGPIIDVPPDLIPPPPRHHHHDDDGPIYEHPKPPRRVLLVDNSKNVLNRSVEPSQSDHPSIHTPASSETHFFPSSAPSRIIRKTADKDLGYLSSDSTNNKNESSKLMMMKTFEIYSETDESTGDDAQSESGAESVETHSVFFGRFSRKLTNSASIDSVLINNDEIINDEENHSNNNTDTDSETVSYTTVVPVKSCHNNNNSLIMSL